MTQSEFDERPVGAWWAIPPNETVGYESEAATDGAQAPVNAADYFQCADCDKAVYRLWLGAELDGGAALCVPCCKARGINPG